MLQEVGVFLDVAKDSENTSESRQNLDEWGNCLVDEFVKLRSALFFHNCKIEEYREVTQELSYHITAFF